MLGHPEIDVAFAFVYFVFCAKVFWREYGERIAGPHFLGIR